MLILLHGFPEDARAWSNFLTPLSEAGFFVVAPDILGYGLSDAHGKLKDYRLDLLVSDLLYLAIKYEKETFSFVGHDWGAAIGWELIRLFPNKVSQVTLMNSPSLRIFKRALLSNPFQILKSWYMFLFQIPWLSETLLFLNNKFVLRQALKEGSNQKIPLSRIEDLVSLWDEKKKISSMLSLYRLLPTMTFKSFKGHYEGPLHIICGDKDPFLKKTLFYSSAREFKSANVTVLKDCGHFPHYEQPEILLNLILNSLQL